jgi:hypothetical protein
MEEAERGIFVTYKEEQRGTNKYQIYSCSCNPEFYGPYEQIILHLKLEHKFSQQEAEIAVYYAKKPITNPEVWMR